MNKKIDEEIKEEEVVEEAVSETDPMEKERDEYKNLYLRALADYQNLLKRSRDDREMIIAQTTKHIYLKLLPFLDNLEKAESFVKDPGVKMVMDNFVTHLDKEGLKELDVLNKPFDPYTAEAIDIVPGKENDVVVEILEKGYEFSGDVLRPAKVKVSKKITN